MAMSISNNVYQWKTNNNSNNNNINNGMKIMKIILKICNNEILQWK